MHNFYIDIFLFRKKSYFTNEHDTDIIHTHIIIIGLDVLFVWYGKIQYNSYLMIYILYYYIFQLFKHADFKRKITKLVSLSSLYFLS